MRPSIQHVLDGLTGAAAFVHNARLDNLAANQLGYALYSDMFSRAAGPGPVNSARYVFLDSGARDFYADWDRAASDVVAVLRSAAGRDPPRPRPIRPRRRALHPERRLPHPLGRPQRPLPRHRHQGAPPPRRRRHHLTYNRVGLAADPGQMLMIWTAEPGSKCAEALALLGSWAATPEQPELHQAPDHP